MRQPGASLGGGGLAAHGKALQQQIPHNHCFGCGPDNPHGLRLQSYWAGDGSAVAEFRPQAWHSAAPKHFVNGGIIATLLDCHCICTATAAAYVGQGRAIGAPPLLHYATGSLTVTYARPTPTAERVTLFARIATFEPERIALQATLSAAGRVCATADVVAVRVPDSWMQQRGSA